MAFIFFFTFEASGRDYFFGFVVMKDLVGISGQIVPSSFWETKVVAIVKRHFSPKCAFAVCQ
jgi:hypothetical protein